MPPRIVTVLDDISLVSGVMWTGWRVPDTVLFNTRWVFSDYLSMYIAVATVSAIWRFLNATSSSKRMDGRRKLMKSGVTENMKTPKKHLRYYSERLHKYP